ncbi:DUF2631 domain-containing protein [Rhodococcus sp. D2-41]|uniref:DUF2631 domain-containing protein n=1 Tax=Speluncibacter jeojiensis TaxID=2710754 RepID=A0A9X4LYI9_9ACTN|nr:DUF2631 domain-containing protein [Rhodococcus sp. D2-41]MDG3010986.1 DUF2631 domain-containing protein [Rhodococcus sp. D2-41]MDG3013961.1 DUF2631 domain-containing protein [Corynebacteriales bacterium D3-21]
MASKQLEHPTLEDAVKASKVDPVDEPSVGWGWHGHATKTFKFFGWFFAAFLLLMIIGNQHGHVEDLYLIGFAILLVVILVWDSVRKRSKWNR